MGTDRHMMIKRLDNWPTLMYKAIDAKQNQPFIWGMYDCCLFVCDVIFAMTGTDMAYKFRDRYSTKEEAYALLRKLTKKRGMVQSINKICEEFGVAEISPTHIQRGDVVTITTELGDTLAICDGDQVLAMGVKGVVALPAKNIKRAWRI